MNFLSYFTDPVLQASTLGSMLMCFSSALVGVLVFLRKRSLVGEALSHAAYPGVVLSAWGMSLLFPSALGAMSMAVLLGASLTSLIGLWVIDFLEHRFRVKNDAALCFVLSFFFGLGVLVASHLQVAHALWYKMAQVFLYGQVATLIDVHVWIYLILAGAVVLVLILLYYPLEVISFDRWFARSIGVHLTLLDGMVFLLLVLAIVIGIRSVGVVLMAGMLIAPAVAARQWTDRLALMFLLAGVFGAISGFLGNYLSVEIPLWGQHRGWGWTFSLPTGPMILLSGSAFAILSLLLAPRRGVISRYSRAVAFRQQCLQENLLKHFWKNGRKMCLEDLTGWHGLSRLKIQWLLWRLRVQGWARKEGKMAFCLTQEGMNRGAHMVRLHRLWEVYLVRLGQGLEKVHRSAEEMEHLITPEIEKELTALLNDPHQDPHHQPIPKAKGLL